MQNLIVFCHSCLAWIEPHSEMCAECAAEVRLDSPDLDLDLLKERLGTPLAELGLVSVERQSLPRFGALLGTTHGLLFLPRLHRRINGAWEGVSAHRVPVWWPFQGEHRDSGFLNWLRRPFALSGRQETAASAEPVLAVETVAERLIDSPGGFFVERRGIRSLNTRRRSTRIERPPFRSINLTDESEAGTLPTALNQWFADADGD